MGVFDAVGTPVTLQQMREWCENPPQGAEQVFQGQSARHRGEAFTARYEESLWSTMVERRNSLRDRAAARVEDADATLDLTEDTIAKAAKDLRSGRMTPEQVLTFVRQIPPVLTSVMGDLDASRDDGAAAAAFMEQDPADFQKAELERFPTLQVPRVTEAFLRGNPGAPDPLAPPRDLDGA
jgi:hypothetical protein